MQLLSLKNFDVSVSGHFLFHIHQLNIDSGEKIGLIGANASGKSTFLKTILSSEGYKSGEMFVRNGLWSYFEQKSSILPEVHHPEHISRWGIQELAYRVDKNFSGGEEARIKLAKAFSEPHDILVLDEPSAHLDVVALRELERQLYYENTYIVVSHDRHFLNKFCTRILAIQDKQLIDFPGNYDEWKSWNELDKQKQWNEYEKAKHEKQRLLSVVQEQKRKAANTQRKPKNLSRSELKARDFGAVGKSIGGKQKSLSAAAKNTEKRIERLGDIKKPVSLPKIRPDFSITDPPQNKVIVEIKGLNFAYRNSDYLFDELDFCLKRNTRTALIGENGVGKSTMLKLIMQGHPNIRVVPKAKFGYFDQSFNNINFEKSILDNIHSSSIQHECINHNVLARMGFPAHILGKKAGVLSGGELTKLSFAKLFVSDFNVLLIDEPSNYLDIPSYEAIESLLLDFEGSMLFCSHDSYFVKAIAEEVWELQNKKIRQVRGMYGL